jgi:hypothetical protein
MSKTIYQYVDELPKGGITVNALKSLDTLVPGKWENLVGFTDTIKTLTGETDEAMVQAIGERAVYLFNDKSEGYQRAMWLYHTVDSASGALGTAAIANQISDSIPILGNLVGKLTPKPEQAQSIDLAVKLVAEIVAFCQINGIPGDSIGDFLEALADYGSEARMRMAALVCFDGLIPLGAPFIDKVMQTVHRAPSDDLEKNPTFKGINDLIPGNDTSSKRNFIGESFDSVKDWMGSFVADNELTQDKVLDTLSSAVEISKDKLNYAGAFLDIAVKYYAHTGTQTLARRLIERSLAEI